MTAVRMMRYSAVFLIVTCSIGCAKKADLASTTCRPTPTPTTRPERTTDFGGLQFIYDVRAFADYSGATRDPRSDGAAVAALLARHDMKFPARMARVRMFHLPTADRRSELMIIYGETLAPNSRIPIGGGDISLDSESPADANVMLEHARRALKVRKK